jgi:hypothetical protein
MNHQLSKVAFVCSDLKVEGCTRQRRWLRRYAASQKIVGLGPDGVVVPPPPSSVFLILPDA